MKGSWTVTVLLVASLVWSCADADEVNATFRQHQVSWYTFDPEATQGFRSLPGFEQAQRVEWVPLDRAVVATDVASVSPGLGAVAVSRLGLLVLSDPAGALVVQRPSSRIDLARYRTGPLFVSKERLFLTLMQYPSGEGAPATLAWWAPGQARMAPFPIPSQVQDPGRQAVAFAPPARNGSLLGLGWKVLREGRWRYESTQINLEGGDETPLGTWNFPSSNGIWAENPRIRELLAQAVGARVNLGWALGEGPSLAFTHEGWVGVESGSGGRVYRLPDLGLAGRYSHALSLSRGWVLTWETSYRAYGGASGLVYIPRPILAP